MNFEGSTQKTSWMFESAQALENCRLEALCATKSLRGVPQYSVRTASRRGATLTTSLPKTPDFVNALRDQELLLRFHGHQIKSLIPSLDQRVKDTAVTYLRRFYLANSVVQHHPRPIAVAALFLASKVEDNRINIDHLARSTYEFYYRIQNNVPCALELPPVSRYAIEQAERKLIQGIDFHFICHHPSDHIEPVVTDVCLFLAHKTTNIIDLKWEEAVLSRAVRLAEHATLHSDAVFLYEPIYVAFALVFLAIMENVSQQSCLGGENVQIDWLKELLREYCATCSSAKLGTASFFLDHTNEIQDFLRENPLMFLGAPVASVEERANKLRRVLQQVASKRVCVLPVKNARGRSPPTTSSAHHFVRISAGSLDAPVGVHDCDELFYHDGSEQGRNKRVRVTPVVPEDN